MLWNYPLFYLCYTNYYMHRLKRYGKIILFDTLAVICFIGVILFGWIPGPGGIPLFLLGLGLLAVNHDWAERWLETAKHHGVSFKQWLFPNTPWVRLAYDLGALLLMSLGVVLIYLYENRLIEGAAVIMICFSLFVFLVNRDRFDSFANLFKKKHKK